MKSIVLSPKIIIDKHKKLNFLIDEDLLNFFNFLKFKIYPININKKKLELKNLKNADGLILAGGGDLFKYKRNNLNKIRDRYETKLFNYFLNRNKPILTICRGSQLVADINGIKLHKIKGHVGTKHILKINKSKYIKNEKLEVNSFHDYSIKDLPKNFSEIACTKDGSIEIIEHKTKKILCLMFHPERKMKSKKSILQSIKKFFK
jgi:gamma-glutamyl-gamma-aminobutyrate hydrolase PuuD|tara:strand:+ start:691 stop:1305 length:615 start_codon:yes stop_codon:yes gene_type:complete